MFSAGLSRYESAGQLPARHANSSQQSSATKLAGARDIASVQHAAVVSRPAWHGAGLENKKGGGEPRLFYTN
jgi:hypothetical protein